MKKFIYYICLCIPLFSCSTLKDSTLLGVGIGGGVGLAIGSNGTQDHKQLMLTSAIGAAIGGLIAAYDYGERNKSGNRISKARRQKDKLKNSTSKVPFLTKPKVQRVWIPEKIEGDKFIEGHWIYVINRRSVWRKD